jgi:chromosome segregation ATPase
VGLQQRQVAASWSDRAAATAEERDDARGRAEALQRQLDEVAESLSVSETDVVALEDRVRELADEKAQAEDVATTTGVERDSLVQLSAAIAASITSLDGCVDQLFDLLGAAIDAFNRQGAGEEVDVGPLNADRTATTARCNAARQDAASAAATADRLLR